MADYIKEIRDLVGTRTIMLPCVRAVILRGASVLLLRRTDNGQWCLPSGAVEIGETAIEAIRREVKEETDLDALEVEPMALYSGENHQYEYPNGDQVQCFAMAFIARRWKGEPRADGEEASEVRFFSLLDLPEDMVSLHRQTLHDFQRYDGDFLLPA